MKRSRLFLLLGTVLAAGLAFAAGSHLLHRIPDIKDSTGAVTLPNGWRITPAGKHIKLPGDLPMKMLVVNGGDQLLVLTAGFHDHSLNVISPRTQELSASLDVVKAWDGMAFHAYSGGFYLSGGGHAKPSFGEALARLANPPAMKSSIDKPILRVRFADGKLTPDSPIAIEGLDEKNRYISGLALGADGALFALNLQTDTLYRLSGPDLR